MFHDKFGFFDWSSPLMHGKAWGMPLRKLRRTKKVILEIEAAIDEAAKRIKKIRGLELDSIRGQAIVDEFDELLNL